MKAKVLGMKGLQAIAGIIILSTSVMASRGLAYAEIDPQLAIRAIIGEASNQGYRGMLAVACGIRNRGTLRGVYGVKAKHIDRQPKRVWNMARKAWAESEHNRIHDGTHWENTKAFGEPYWVKDMDEVYRHKDHVFYKERG